MSFQTVLSIVGMAFTAFELYQRFRQKDSSGGRINTEHNSAQSTISPREEPKQSGAGTSVAPYERSGAERNPERRPKVESKIRNGLSGDQSADQRPIIKIYFFLPLKCQNKIN